jgi:hypothetical protein
MQTPRVIFSLGVLLLAGALPAAAQATALEQDSARAEIRSVLRAFYLTGPAAAAHPPRSPRGPAHRALRP